MYLPIHNFADDALIIAASRSAAEEVAREFISYLQDFQMQAHKGTPSKPKSKTVVVHFYSSTAARDATDHSPILMDPNGNEFVNFESSVVYLGALLNDDLRDDADIRSRICKATQMFGYLRRNLMASKKVWTEVKRRIFIGMLIPTLLDGAETWIVTAALERELTTAFNDMVRSSLRLTTHTTWKHHITTEELLRKIGLNNLALYLDWKLLSYAGHVQRMDDKRLPRVITNSTNMGKCRSGGQHKKHSTQILSALRRCDIENDKWKELAQDRLFWNNRIKSPEHRQIQSAKLKKRRWAEDPMLAQPALAVGRHAEKQFHARWHVGIVSAHDDDADNYCTTWTVSHEDGDSEDCNWKELQPILCPLDEENYMRSIIDPHECAPAMALRKTVAKIFGGATYYGVVCGCDVDVETNEHIWQVQYNDGDVSDYNIQELRAILVE